MVLVALGAFLIGAVLAWAFRVWVLIPVTLMVFVALTLVSFSLGTLTLATFAGNFLFSLVPQLGYAFGLLTRTVLFIVRVPHEEDAAMLAKRSSVPGN